MKKIKKETDITQKDKKERERIKRENKISEKTVMPWMQREYMNNTKVANYLSDARKKVSMDGIENVVKVIPKMGVSVGFSLKADENISFSSDSINMYDMAIMDAVCTLHEYDCYIFTPAMVARVMTGSNSGQKMNEKMVSDVSESLKKLMHVFVRIDFTNEYIARGLAEQGDSIIKESYLLPMSAIKVTTANHKGSYEGFKLLDEPILYTYAKRIRQVICIPVGILSTSGSKYNTKEIILLKKYLISRIETMKNMGNKLTSTSIIYERCDRETGEAAGMFPVLGYQKEDYSNWRKKKASIHDSVCTILDAFIDKKYITCYQILKEGNRINGVDIIL